jgi:hypothetical protein
MKKLKQIIFDLFCGIGKDPGPFIAGGVSVILGFLLGIAFMLSIK